MGTPNPGDGLHRPGTKRTPGGWLQARVGRAWIDCLTWEQAITEILRLARETSDRRAVVVTPNIQHIVMLEDDPQLQGAYERADLVLPDGAPVALLAGSRVGHRQRRIAGADLLPVLCGRAADEGLSVGFLGGLPGAAQEAMDRLTATHPHLRVVFLAAPEWGFETDPDQVAPLLASVQDRRPDLLMLGLGTPKQEAFVTAHARELGGGVALCIGAAIDYAGGAAERAPLSLQRLGLEWLWRLKEEPRRLGPRYARATPRFTRMLGPELSLAVAKRVLHRP